ncbi:MAG: phosphoribosyltransferase family protein [Pseudomonadota bacterium]
MALPDNKLYLDAQQLLDDSFTLAAQAYDEGLRPTCIVAVWRGGTPIGLAVQEYFAARGCATDHIAIRTSSYHGIDNRAREVAVYGLSYLIKNLTYDDSLLIVDDVFDTGRSIEAILSALRSKLRLNMPREVKIAVPYYKPSRNETALAPDYFLHETDRWLKFPTSLEGLSNAEIATHRPDIYAIIEPYLPN